MFVPEQLPQDNIGKGSHVSTKAKALHFIRGRIESNEGNIEGDKVQQRQQRGGHRKKISLEFANKNNLWVDDLYSLRHSTNKSGNENTCVQYLDTLKKFGQRNSL